jgi:predicted ATP-grasp superfamily ATP-dependent carboligase
VTQFSFAALCKEGRVLASVTARRTRQYPVDFGHSSCFVETIDPQPFEEPARRLLAAMRYTGLAEVEFKYDERDRRFKLLEVNPRAWTWHALCLRAGVDFPYLLWQLAHGGQIPEIRGQAGVRWIRVSTDLAAAWTELRRGRLSLAGYTSSLRPPIVLSTFAPDDPMPSLLRLPHRAYSQGKQLLGAAWPRRQRTLHDSAVTPGATR